MILFGCDWCNVTKQPEETWLLGLAAESIGVTAARREITILSAWDDAQACHPLAVHFCSVQHKDNYMAALFETDQQPAESIIKTKTRTTGNRTAEREYMRTVSTGVVREKKRVTRKRRRAA